ncbi:MAG TPA: imidazole glycerol phosphate synthase subunit HisH [Hellea balneolensis]|uniref:Imidazole glycerol phosphate synthase subunit HisH n=1 Tax=Hellea balneolensis TaxID=287478 RepID=A0A7C3G0L9_9PROT|nr:imidazole glycerol phosphate synthase subunit HisH [Hellea balneolensis]
MSSLVIVDTGCANLASVGFAFERLDIAAQITADPEVIKAASHVVVPGVGAAAYAIKKLHARGLVDVLKNLKQPVLGICLGMQLLYEKSQEGDTECLALIKGEVEEMQADQFPLPHMGWNTLKNVADNPLLAGVTVGDYVYFVHSYAVPLSEATLAACDYGGEFSAVVNHGNIYGCQFHPERSGVTGARILQNFVGL